MTVETNEPSSRHRRAALGLLFGAIAALFVGLVAYQIYVTHQAAVAAAVTDVNNLALVLESKLTDEFAAAQRTASAMVSNIEPDAMHPELAERYSPAVTHRLKDSIQYIPSASGLRYFDANGDRLYSSVDGDPPLNVADRPHFQLTKGSPIGTTVFSEVTLGRITRRVSIYLDQAIRSTDGSFLGIASVAFDLDSLHRHFQSIDVGKAGVVALRRLDNGASIVRFPATIEVDNKPTPDLPVRHAILRDGPVGVMHIESRIDGTQRIYGYRKIDAFPLFIAVGIADSDYLAEWRKDSVMLLVSSSLFLAVLAAVFFRLAVVDSRRSRSESLLSESEQRFRSLFEQAAVGVAQIETASGRFVRVNQRYCDLVGRSQDEMLAIDFQTITHPDDLQADLDKMEQFKTGRIREYRAETRYFRADGRLIWVSLTASLMGSPGDSLKYHIAVVEDITERKRLEEKVRQLAFYDVLTELPNRRLLLDRLTQAMAAGKRTGRYGALLFLDLDNFKPLNDTHGHEAGDLLLIEVARRLRSSVREIDTVSRFGGDEFAVLLSDVVADKVESTKEVGIIAEKIRVILVEPYLLEIRRDANTVTTVEHRCSASIGVVVFIDHECSQEDIIRRADNAMYQAKDAGRNTVAFHEANDEV
jgi:diguanylate cyclase (GGDEF)-like protein/PAS domain S-box-containing protein